jgi:hypothetical protein
MKFTSDDTQDWSIGANSTAGFTIYDETDSLYRFCVKDGGNVGIGTTDPETLFHVSSSSQDKIVLIESGDANVALELRDVNAVDGDVQFVGVGDELRIDTGNTESVRIDGDGNVGIGTITPEFALDVNGDIRIEDSHFLRFGDDDSDSQWIMQHAGADLNFGEVGVADNVLFLEAGGRVGVGTNNPDGGWLHVNSAGTDQTLKLESTDGNVDAIWKDTGGSGIIRFATDTFKFYTDAAYSVNPLNLKGADVGIGTAGPTEKLHVVGNSLLNGTVHASGASFQKSLGEVLYLRNALNIIEINAILQHAPNIQYVKPEPTSAPGVSVIPTELPLADADNVGLEITVVQDWSADPTAALSVQKQTGSSDVIYEGASNTASTTVSIAAYRGANKTFVIAAAGVWMVIN